jgi:hypothetical protein
MVMDSLYDRSYMSDETTYINCRYGSNAATVLKNYTVIYDVSESDYQGSVEVLAQKGSKYKYIQYSYGSCSGCDDWEARDLNDSEIEREMKRLSMNFSSLDNLKKWGKMLEETGGNAALMEFIKNLEEKSNANS